MEQREIYNKGRALDCYIEQAIAFIRVSVGLEHVMWLQLSENDYLLQSVFEPFWGQELSLRALSESLSYSTVAHEAPGLLVQALKSRNTAQGAAIAAALSLTYGNSQPEHIGRLIYDAIPEIYQAHYLHAQIKGLIKKIRLEIIREGFPCR
jgi:hypothetical protein